MAINITDSLNAATTKGKLGDAKQIFLNGDTKSLQQAHEETNAHLDTLDNRSTQMENAINDISVTGGALTASAVSYSNSTSGLEAITAQGAIDEVYSNVNNRINMYGTAAQTAAEAANTAAALANQKATAAQTATDACNTATTNANDATAAANTATTNAVAATEAAVTAKQNADAVIALANQAALNWEKNW